MTNNLFSHACVIKPHKQPKGGGSGKASQLNRWRFQDKTLLEMEGDSIPCHHTLFCASFPSDNSYHISCYNKLCQPMVVSTNSTPQIAPVWGPVKKETLFSAKQFNCDTALLWHRVRPLWLANSALFLSALLCTVLVWSYPSCAALARYLCCFSWTKKDTLLRHSWKLHSGSWKKVTYMNTSPHPWPLIGLFSCKRWLQGLEAWLVQKALSCPKWCDSVSWGNPSKQKVTSSIPGQGTCVGLPWIGEATSVSFSHWYSLSLSSPISKNK